jgi:hypothetical protein
MLKKFILGIALLIFISGTVVNAASARPPGEPPGQNRRKAKELRLQVPSPRFNPTGMPNADPSKVAAPRNPKFCDSTETTQHPAGLALANQLGVPYAEIMGWFCQGYGFGEIALAYTISKQAGVPVADVFALRASGMGWGEILKHYSTPTDPNPYPEPPKPTQVPWRWRDWLKPPTVQPALGP